LRCLSETKGAHLAELDSIVILTTSMYRMSVNKALDVTNAAVFIWVTQLRVSEHMRMVALSSVAYGVATVWQLCGVDASF
jgi:hypothetical protein